MFTLYGYEVSTPLGLSLPETFGRDNKSQNNPRTRILRIIAAAEAIPVQLVEVIPRKNVNKDMYMERFPLSRGKIPALEGPNVGITETLAIATYLSKITGERGLLGDGSLEQEARVLSWVNWANQEFLPTLATWFLPLIPGLARPAPYDYSAIEAGKVDSLALLHVLEARMQDTRYLVGNHMTLADIFVAVFVSRGLEWVLGEDWRTEHPGTMRHFESVREWEPVKLVVAKFVMIAKETANINPYA